MFIFWLMFWIKGSVGLDFWRRVKSGKCGLLIFRPEVFDTLPTDLVLHYLRHIVFQDPVKCSEVPPIEVLWVKGRDGGDYYCSFGGCHRYAAHKRLGSPTIRAKLVKSTIADLCFYLGGFIPGPIIGR
jgi:hypothetical protein